MGAWMLRSKKVATGSGKPSSPNGAAGCSDGFSSLSALRSIHTEGSAFGAYYHRLVERGRKYGLALMAVMRNMLAVAVHLLKHEQENYDPCKVCASSTT
jgi:hypothetical protein